MTALYPILNSRYITIEVSLYKELVEAAHTWKDRAERAEARVVHLEAQVEKLMARVNQLEHDLYGKKSEKDKKKSELDSLPDACSSREQGEKKSKKQSGKKRPDRRNHDHLPLEAQEIDLPEDQTICQACGNSFKEFPALEESETIEIEVKAYRRKIRRKRYMRQCNCETNHSKVVTAPSPGKVVPKGKLGVSIWVSLLMGKFLFHQPVERQLSELELLGVSIPAPTVTDGFKRIDSLIKPVYKAIAEKSQSEEHWHVDESRWMVAEKVEGKSSTRWWIWAFKSVNAVYYKLSKSRSSEVLKDHLGGVIGTISCDRFSAYIKFAEDASGKIDLAHCWAHARRDFISVGKKYTAHTEWAENKIEAIGYLYHLHHIRKTVYQEDPGGDDFKLMNEVFRDGMLGFKDLCEVEHQKLPGDNPRSLALENIGVYWQGLSMVLVDPMLDMDNNAAERAIRGPVVGRKNYWGSIAEWSGHFAMVMFTVFQTLLLWGINPRAWLGDYLEACAREGSAPSDLSGFLPWSCSPEKYEKWSKDAPDPVVPGKINSP